MKKNITINMFGALYAIDEDAYELLNQYQSHMRRYFSHKDGGEEIAEDIERRVAELFAELKASGVEAITMEHVQDIIARIGNPEEVDGEEASPEESGGEKDEGNVRKNKKLFRDSDDKMLGGISSGLACFFGIDALWIRLLWILLTWFSGGAIILLYLILWVIVPEAWTPEERLQMQGRPVNMKNLRDEIMQGARKAGRYAAASETKTTAKGCLNTLFEILVVLLKGCLIFLAGGFLLFCVIVLACIVVGLCVCYIAFLNGAFTDVPGESFVFDFVAGHIGQGIYWTALVGFVFWLALTIYIGIHLIMRAAGRVQPMTWQKRTVFAILWIVAIIIGVTASISGYISYEHYRQECRSREDAIRTQHQLDYLNSEGWRVVRYEHCSGYVKSGEYYTNDRNIQYIDTWSQNPNMAYELERTVRVAPGIYRLEAVARTDGHGCTLFAITRKGAWQADVPVHGNIGGEIWQEAKQMQKDGYVTLGMWRNITETNFGKGYGWSRVVIDSIVVDADSMVRYGVSNVRGKRWDGTWFSATDFDLKKVVAK